MTFRQTGDGSLTADPQGSFAPEQLNPEGGDDVFSRRFTDDVHIVDVSAAPTIPSAEQYDGAEHAGYEVTSCTERRDVGDDGGDTSEYEWEVITDQLVPYDQAVTIARNYVFGIVPEVHL